MNYLRDTAFVIKRTNIGEADRYITFFTREHGKADVVAKGVRRLTSKRSPHLELLNEIKFSAIKTRKNYILTEVEIINTFSDIKSDHSHIGFIFLICELLDKLCVHNQKHEDIYFLIRHTLLNLQKQSINAITTFETKMLTSLGFWDGKREFKDREDLEQFIEGVTERKIKSRKYLKM